MDRIALSNAAFEGDNNAYLFADGRETTLVDPGDWMATTREQLARGLADRGLEFADVDRILLTHWHADRGPRRPRRRDCRPPRKASVAGARRPAPARPQRPVDGQVYCTRSVAWMMT
jgi:hypothetical protein